MTMIRVAPLALLLVAACSNVKPQASALVVAVERFHRASNEERPAYADALSQVSCVDTEVCAAKAACAAATTSTAAALRLKQEVEAVLAEVEGGKRSPDDPILRELPAKLTRATELLERGHAAMPACDEKILVLRERYEL